MVPIMSKPGLPKARAKVKAKIGPIGSLATIAVAISTIVVGGSFFATGAHTVASLGAVQPCFPP